MLLGCTTFPCLEGVVMPEGTVKVHPLPSCRHQRPWCLPVCLPRRLVTQVLLHPSSLPVNVLLDKLRQRAEPSTAGSSQLQRQALGGRTLPVLLLWGELDPWCTPAIADRIMAYYPDATRVNVNAGHCPHDETPGAVNEALLGWVASLG